MEEKKLCKKCGENPIINKYAKYCSPCLNAFRREKKASKIPKENKAASGMEKPEKARKTANAAVIIEFGKHASILTAVEKMADEEMRPVDMQIIYMLKKQLQIYEVQDES